MRLIIRFLCLVVCFVSYSSCTGKFFESRLNDAWEHVASQSSEIERNQANPETLPLTWSEAVKLLEERNQTLVSGRKYTENILKEKNNQWKTWLPRPSILANFNSSLTQLGNLSISDLSTSIIAPLAIPNPYSEVARSFENSLSYVQSLDNYKLAYRRQTISLYRIFSKMGSMENNQILTSLESSKNINEGISTLQNLDSRNEQLEDLQVQLVQLLNLPGKKLIPVARSRPKVNYEDRLDSFVLGKNYGRTAMRLASYNIEAALLQEKGVRLRKWPTLNFNVATPALYNSDNTNLDPTDPDGIYLFGGVFKNYDFLGTDTDSILTAKQNVEFVKTNLRLQLDSDIRNWRRLLAQYKKIRITKQLAHDRLYSLKSDSSGMPASVHLKLVRAAMKNFTQYEQSKEQLDLEIWTWDDDAWN